MDIHDFVNGSAYITLCRSDFKSDYVFDGYCRFMRKLTNCDALKIYVINGEPELEINRIDPDDPNDYAEDE